MEGKIEFKKEAELPLLVVTSGSMLSNKTSSWRNIKPLLHTSSCVGCMICWKYCPEAAIEIEEERPVFNYDYCKGCGICAKECPRRSIEMVVEEK